MNATIIRPAAASAVVGLGFFIAACAGREGEPQEHAHPSDSANPAATVAVPLYDNLGDHGRDITTESPEADAYFDQGLRLQYAFNHAEAIASYETALASDPECAMCWWGIALAHGPNINAPMSAESGRAAYAAIVRARALSSGASDVERALIDALAERYGPDPAADRAGRDSAYSRAMARAAERSPGDADVLTLYAASLMNLSPWNYWSGDYGDRRPNPGTERLLAALESALELEPDHPGACHYYIHALEAAYPERAVGCAERLADLMPGAGHIVHMPGHIYIRVGRYADAVRANEHAVHSDETYIRDRDPKGLYPSAYYPHNYHFMAFAATMAGMSEKAMEAARIVAPKVPADIAREVYWIQNVIVFPQLTAVTFGRWEDVLAASPPDPDLVLATVMHEYARGVALAATGDTEAARAALADVRRMAEEIRASESDAGPAPPSSVSDITLHALAGEIALRSGDAAEAVSHFEAAAEIEDGMLYEEPPLWYYPIRHSLGRALLEAGRPAEAERAYREDLARFPANGWSLFGLALSLEAQGNDASEARSAFRKAWAGADVELTGSRF